MATVAEIKNLALFTLGFVNEVDFSVTTDPTVQKVDRIYETSKEFVISSYFWRFAEKRKELTSRLTETDTFTADDTTDFITVTGSIWDNLEVELSTTGTLPAGLSTDTTYYTVNYTGSTAQLSLTRGGSAIDITDTGTGVHTITFMAVNNSPFQYLYKYPSDYMVLRKAYTSSNAVSPVNIFETTIDGYHTDSQSNEGTLWMWYLYDVDETLYPTYFVDYFKYKLALDLCFNLTGDTELMKLIFQQEQQMLAMAKNVDARQVQARTIKSSPFTSIRGR